MSGDARRSIASLILVQLFSKIVNFSLNVAIVKYAEKNTVGIGAVPLALLLSTVQFLSREGVRGACQRVHITGPNRGNKVRIARIVNLSWSVLGLACLIGPIALRILVALGYPGISSEDLGSVAFWFSVAAVLELAAEPAFNLIIACEYLHVKAAVEGCSVFVKAFITVVGVVVFNAGPMALAYAQLGFAASQLMGYYGYIIVVGGSEASPIPAIGLLTPRTPPATDKSESGILAHYCGERESAEASALTRQSLLKWILTEGDKLVLLSAKRRALQHSDAGDPAAGAVVPTDNLRSMDAVYGVVFNLGSLLGRLVLEPIEIQSRAQFSKVVSFRNRHLNAPQNRAALKEYREKWTQITRAFSFRMRLLLYISLIIVCIGPPYCWLLMHTLYGKKYSDTQAPEVLGWYCFYVLLMAVNGLTEAFRDSLATKQQLQSYSATGLSGFMLLTFVASSAMAMSLVPRLGSVGIVFANSLNLLLRAIYSTFFIIYRTSTPPGTPKEESTVAALLNAVPKRRVWVGLALASLAVRVTCVRSDAALAGHATHVGTGIICGIGVVYSVLLSDDEIRHEAFGRWLTRRNGLVFKLLQILRLAERGPADDAKKDD